MTCQAEYHNEDVGYDFIADATYASGEVIQCPDGRCGVIAGLRGAVSGDAVKAETCGLFRLLKAAATVFTAGDVVYWNNSTNLAVAAATGSFVAGICVEDAGNGPTRVKVLLNGCPNSIKGPLELTNLTGAMSGALLLGSGTSALPTTTDTADSRFINLNLENEADTGDNRGMYLRFTLSGTGAGGGESLRAFTVVEGSLGTAHGAHLSLGFSTTGLLSGLGAACRATLHIPDDLSPTGTICGGMSEVYCDGDGTSTAAFTGCLCSCHRFNIDGDATAAAKVPYALEFAGMNALTFKTGTLSGTAKGLSVCVNNTQYYIPLYPTCA